MIIYHKPITDGYRVVVRYDDPRGGTWRGETRVTHAEALKDLDRERARVHGQSWLEKVGNPKE